MPQRNDARSALYERPLPLRLALARLDELIGREQGGISRATRDALRSTAIQSVRYALRKPDGTIPGKQEVMDTDLRPLLSVLHVAARQAAEANHHKTPSDHANRAHRFVQAVTGERYDRARLSIPLPDAWQRIADVFPGPNGAGEFAFLWRCSMIAGVHNAPRSLPSYDALIAAAKEFTEAGKVPKRVAQCATMYRRARRILLQEDPPEDQAALRAQYAPFPQFHSPRATHLGIEPWAQERLKEMGLEPATMSAEQILRTLAPELAGDYDYWVAE